MLQVKTVVKDRLFIHWDSPPELMGGGLSCYALPVCSGGSVLILYGVFNVLEVALGSGWPSSTWNAPMMTSLLSPFTLFSAHD